MARHIESTEPLYGADAKALADSLHVHCGPAEFARRVAAAKAHLASAPRSCAWCNRPCEGIDESGDPACSSCLTEGDAAKARDAKRSRDIRASIAEDIAAITQSLAHH